MADMPDTQDSLIAQLQDASNAAAWANAGARQRRRRQEWAVFVDVAVH